MANAKKDQPTPPFRSEDELESLRTVWITARQTDEEGWTLEVDYDGKVSPYEAHAMIEMAYYRQRALVYPGHYNAPEEDVEDDGLES